MLLKDDDTVTVIERWHKGKVTMTGRQATGVCDLVRSSRGKMLKDDAKRIDNFVAFLSGGKPAASISNLHYIDDIVIKKGSTLFAKGIVDTILETPIFMARYPDRVARVDKDAIAKWWELFDIVYATCSENDWVTNLFTTVTIAVPEPAV